MSARQLTAERLKGVWAGIPIPWDKNYGLEEIIFVENLKRLCRVKVHGIYTTGSTGEFYVLNFEEFKRVVDIFIEVVSPTAIPTQIGCGSPDPRVTFRMIEYAAEKGVTGIQVVLPFWMELNDMEVLKFFKDAAKAAGATPLIHYNIPRAKRFLGGGDYLKISEVVPSLIGVKFTYAGAHFGGLQQALLLTPNISYFVTEELLV